MYLANVSQTSRRSVINSWFEPQVEFLEFGIDNNGQRTWAVYGPDLDGRFGGMQGVGGIEAMNVVGAPSMTLLQDSLGHVLGTVGNSGVRWSSARFGAYGPLLSRGTAPLRLG